MMSLLGNQSHKTFNLGSYEILIYLMNIVV